MSVSETTTAERVDSEELLDASVRQLEALTALAAAPVSGRELEQLFEGLAEQITRLTDYRTCLVSLFTDEAPYCPRLLSYSANVPAEYVERFVADAYPRAAIHALLEKGERIEVGALGFAAYYPPSRYHWLDATVPDRGKAEIERRAPADGARPWHDGDELVVPLLAHDGEFLGIISLDDPRSGRAPDRRSVLPAVAFARQTAQLIARWRDAERLAAQAEREALINRLSHAIRATLNLPEIMHTATHELGRALAASRAYIRPFDPARPDASHVMYEYLAPGCRGVGPYTISYSRPVGQFLMTRLKTLVVNDARDHDDDSPEMNAQLKELGGQSGTRSMVFCPLVVQGRFRGTLVIHQTDRVRRWERDDIALIEAVAAQLATGVAQAELFEMVTRAKRAWEVTFDAMSDGIFIFSNERLLARVNRAGAALEGVEPSELIGRRCCDILRRGGGESCIIERVAAEGRGMTIEYTPERLGRPLLVTAEPLVDSSGQVGTVCTVRDLSELRRVETLARERQSLLENVLESAREAIAAISPEGHIMWCNSAAAGMSGYSKEEMIGRSIYEMIEEGEVERRRESIRRALEGHARTDEVRFRTRTGEMRCALADTAPLVVEGRTTGVLTISRDITEQKQERERAAQADKLRALGQLASGVAHDFNNALAAILGRAQLLRRTTSDPQVARGLDIIQTAAEDAAATVRRIRAFAQQSPGEGFAPVELDGLLRDAVEITRTRWENDARARGLSYDVRLEVDCAASTHGNPSELREVFVNLIVNAIDAMPEGGRLSITCRCMFARLQLDFTDTGVGMTEDVRARIFEPFYTTKGVHGTGLGLFVSYGIVERHGGHIEVTSERGRGATFTLDLPYAGTPAPARAGVATSAVESPPPLSILVVDDEQFVRETLAEMVEVFGHRVRLADGGRAALALLEEDAFDLVFTDLSMPGMDGWELAREIRRRWPALRVCIVTGYGKEAGASPDADGAADAVIGKPFDFAQVEATLARFKKER